MSANKSQKLVICEPSSTARTALESALDEAGLSAFCAFDGKEGKEGKEGESLAKPMRLGAFLDRIARHAAHLKEEIRFGPYHLPAATLDLKQEESGEITRLTDKEKEILLALKHAPGNTLGRTEMLEEIWGYGSNIETHTLETHIYRLRQKIEEDAGDPQYLITNEAGYKLNL